MKRAVFLVSALLVVLVGTLWAFQRGANDFSVFFEAWRLVMSGRGLEVYGGTPDRFLYAPGFAWLLAPLGLLPRAWALGLWCFGKALLLFWIVSVVARWASAQKGRYEAAAFLGVVVVARPLLIDFQYGQVNLYLLAAVVWALDSHLDPSKSGLKGALPWFALGMVSVIKLLTAPLLALPWIAQEIAGGAKARRTQIVASLSGGFAILLLPLIFGGWDQFLELHTRWLSALVDRGLPMESHNQSFMAFLHHLFSGNPTPVVALARAEDFSVSWLRLDGSMIRALSLAWVLGSAGAILVWQRVKHSSSKGAWAVVLCGLLILPSHLLWKPYFLFGLPAAAFLAARAQSMRSWIFLAGISALINLSGFDFVGHGVGVRFEAWAGLLWTHIVLLLWVTRAGRSG